MLIKTKGIVLRAFKYAETSMIVEIYTQAKGLKKYIVSGVRARKSKVSPNLLQVLSIVDMVAYDKDKDLNRIKEIRPAYIYQQLPFDIFKSSVGLFLAEIAQKTLRQAEENLPLYHFLESSFQYLDQTDSSISNFHLWYLVQFSQYLGFYPSGIYSASTSYFDLKEGIFMANPPLKYGLTIEESQVLDGLLERQMNETASLPIKKALRQKMLQHLIDYYRLHIESLSEIHAHKILKEVFQ